MELMQSTSNSFSLEGRNTPVYGVWSCPKGAPFYELVSYHRTLEEAQHNATILVNDGCYKVQIVLEMVVSQFGEA
jgi:hypothetical protein